MRSCPFLKRGSRRTQANLSRRKLRTNRNGNFARQPNNTLIGANSWAGQHCKDCFFRNVGANDGEITVKHLQNLRAMVATFTEVLIISAKSFFKHAATCYFSSILSNICSWEDCSVTQDALRENICSEIARRLKKERLRQKLSLNALAAKAGLNRQTVSFIEQEQRTPTIDSLLRITEVLKIELSDVLVGAKRAANRRTSKG